MLPVSRRAHPVLCGAGALRMFQAFVPLMPTTGESVAHIAWQDFGYAIMLCAGMLFIILRVCEEASVM